MREAFYDHGFLMIWMPFTLTLLEELPNFSVKLPTVIPVNLT